MLHRLFSIRRCSVVLFSLTGLFLSIAAVAQPIITLSVSNGPPTTKLLVSGSGFDPYSAVDIYFDTKDEALAVTDGNGAFGKIGITVPGSAKPGGHWITGVERYTGLAGQSRFLVNTNWTQFHFSPDRNRANPYENVLDRSNVRRLSLRWKSLLGSQNPVVANGVLYDASFEKTVFAADALTGRMLWQFTTGNDVNSSPAVANGVVFIGSDDFNIYALEAKTGAKLWSYQTGGYVRTTPAIANGVVYVTSFDDNIYALDARNGTQLWKYTTGSAIYCSPSVVDGVVYFGSGDYNVYALDASSGTVLWQFTTNGPVESSPAVEYGVVYFGSTDHSVYALKASSGQKLWAYATGDSVVSSPAVVNGVLYVASWDGNLYALSASTGAFLWKHRIYPFGIPESPAVANGVVYISAGENEGGILYALDALSGALLWKYTTDVYGLSSPVVVNGVLYVGSDNLNVYAFDLSGSDADATLRPPDPHTLVPDLQLKVSLQ